MSGKQQLTKLEEYIVALLKADVPLMLAWDGEKSIFLEAVISDPSADDDPPFDQDEWLEFQVSDGLPGERSACESYYSLEEAQTGFEKCCKEGRVA